MKWELLHFATTEPTVHLSVGHSDGLNGDNVRSTFKSNLTMLTEASFIAKFWAISVYMILYLPSPDQWWGLLPHSGGETSASPGCWSWPAESRSAPPVPVGEQWTCGYNMD
jgi:hypothetical protein